MSTLSLSALPKAVQERERRLVGDLLSPAVGIGGARILGVHCNSRSRVLLQEEGEEEEKKMQEEKWKKVKKGWLAVRVGLEGGEGGGGGFRRFTIPISYLHHPQFRRLLEAAQEVYGYRSPGPLRLPCSVDDFLHLRWLIEHETHSSHHHHHHYHTHHRISSFSLHSDA